MVRLPLDLLDTEDFSVRAGRTNVQDPAKAARIASTLIEGARRLRKGRPTKQVEAVNQWIQSLERDVIGGDFHRTNELREAIIAAGEEIGAAANESTELQAPQLRDAMLSDALHALTQSSSTLSRGWLVAAALGGILAGIYLGRRFR